MDQQARLDPYWTSSVIGSHCNSCKVGIIARRPDANNSCAAAAVPYKESQCLHRQTSNARFQLLHLDYATVLAVNTAAVTWPGIMVQLTTYWLRQPNFLKRYRFHNPYVVFILTLLKLMLNLFLQLINSVSLRLTTSIKRICYVMLCTHMTGRGKQVHKTRD